MILIVKALGLKGLFIFLALIFGLFVLCKVSLKVKLPRNKYSKVTWEDMPWLYDGVARMANKARISTPNIYIEDNPIPTAYSFQNSIVLSAGLLEILNEEEVLAVAAHEIGHIKNGDTVLFPLLRYGKYIMGIITAIIVIFATGFITKVVSFLVFVIYAFSLLKFLRKREFLADRVALQIAEVPYALKSALEELKFYEEALKTKEMPLPTIQPSIRREEKREPQIFPLPSTHPSYDERIARIIAIVEMYRRLEFLN